MATKKKAPAKKAPAKKAPAKKETPVEAPIASFDNIDQPVKTPQEPKWEYRDRLYEITKNKKPLVYTRCFNGMVWTSISSSENKQTGSFSLSSWKCKG